MIPPCAHYKSCPTTSLDLEELKISKSSVTYLFTTGEERYQLTGQLLQGAWTHKVSTTPHNRTDGKPRLVPTHGTVQSCPHDIATQPIQSS